MKLLDRLRNLAACERGNVLLAAAASLPLLLGGAAFGVDTAMLALSNRQLQRAADSSAIAGARAVVQSREAGPAARSDLDENNFPDLSQPALVEVGPYADFSRAVHVRLTARRSLPFMSLFTDAPATITAEATAALVEDGIFCVFSLYEGADTGIDINGNADLTLGCGMKANSRSNQAVTAGGSSRVTGSPIAAVGGLDGETNNFMPPTRLQPYSALEPDPLEHVPDPAPQSDCGNNIRIGPDDVQTLTPGCYRSLDIKGDATFLSGDYYINGGDVTIGAQADVAGQRIAMILTGPNGQAGNLVINAGATLDLTPQDSGSYAGVLFFRDRRAELSEVTISGGADLRLTGALYFPTSDISFVGHSGLDVACLQLIGQKIRFRGSASIRNRCPANSGAAAFRQTVVRLVE